MPAIARIVLWVAMIAAMVLITLFAIQQWGLAGSAVLLVFWLVFYAASKVLVLRSQKKAREIMAGLSPEQRAAVLNSLSESDRAEILAAEAAERT